jgi:GntR family transcriptional regulator, transcriptional repressor for pyruvate dehydrogenase complex
MKDLNETITNQFIIKILSGQWKADEWLPAERVLAEDFQVGRPTIHSVLIRLQEIGFVEIVPRQGVKVVDFIVHGKIGAVEIVIDLFKNEIPETMKLSLFHFLYDNFRSVVEGCLRTGLSRKQLLPPVDTEEQKDELKNMIFFSDMFFHFYQTLAVETQNMVYPLLINSFKSGIMNAIAYVKDTVCIYEKMRLLENAIRDQDFEKAHFQNYDIFNTIYDSWK